MITFTILLVTLLSLAIAAVLIIAAGGLGFAVAFCDVLVCALVIWLIIRLIVRLRG